jgi:hypothetical protein
MRSLGLTENLARDLTAARAQDAPTRWERHRDQLIANAMLAVARQLAEFCGEVELAPAVNDYVQALSHPSFINAVRTYMISPGLASLATRLQEARQ